MLDGVINQFFEKWFEDQEKMRSGADDWHPPASDTAEYALYMERKESAWSAWLNRGNYPLMTKKAISLPEDMYQHLNYIRDARQSEIENKRSPAIQRDLITHAFRQLGDYLIRNDIAGKKLNDL